MALRTNWKDPKTGVVVPSAYARVSSILLGKVSRHIPGAAGWRMNITVHVWNSEVERDFESHHDPELRRTFLGEKHYTTQPPVDEQGDLATAGGNIIEQAYAYLATLPEFKNSAAA